MRPFISVVLWLVFLAILGGIGVSIYNAGVSAGLAQAGTVAGGAVTPYVYGWGFHPGFFGFGFLGLLFPILFLFVIFGLIRAAMFGGRRGWGPGHGWQSGTGPDGWRSERERYLADMHRRMHEAEGSSPSGATTTGPGTSGSDPSAPGSGPGTPAR
jgi:hypothetical protein